MEPEILYVDHSTLRATASCATQATMRYHLGYRAIEPSVKAQAGTAIHEALAVHFRGGSPAEVLARFEAAWKPVAATIVDPTRLAAYTWENLDALLRVWVDIHPLDRLPYVVPPTMVEVGAQAMLTRPGWCLCGHLLDDKHSPDIGPCYACACPRPCVVVLRGRLDALAIERATGGWRVVDHKSTGQMTTPWIDAYHDDSQMSAYTWLARQHLDQEREPVRGAIINAIEIGVVPASARACRKHGVDYAECGRRHLIEEPDKWCRTFYVDRSDAQLEVWRDDAIRLARRFRELRALVPLDGAPPRVDRVHAVGMQGQWTGKCGFCDFKQWCRNGRQPAEVPTLLAWDPWQPFETTEPAAAGAAA